LIKCPEECSKSDGIVWGSGIYTDDSVICKAAIHAGILNDVGGERIIEIVKGP